MDRLEIKSETKPDAFDQAKREDPDYTFIRSFKDQQDGKRTYVFVK